MAGNIEIKKILILDDDPDYRKLLVISLGMLFKDTRLEEYDPHRQGIPGKDFDWSEYDALILDYDLGIAGTTGLDILDAHHARDNFPPTIMLTGAGNEDVSVRAMKAGVYDYLRKESLKSKKIQHLGDALMEACAKHKAERGRLNILEAARKVAKLEASEIYGAYKAKYMESQQKEEARIKVERLKLKEEMRKKLMLLKEIEKSRVRAERAKQEAQGELEKLKAGKKELKKSGGRSEEKSLQQKLQEAQAKLEQMKRNVAETTKEHDIVEDTLAKSQWKLEKQEVIQQQLDADLANFREEFDEPVKTAEADKKERSEANDLLDEITSQLEKKVPE